MKKNKKTKQFLDMEYFALYRNQCSNLQNKQTVQISDKLHESQVKSQTFLGYHLQDQIYLGNVSLNEPVRKWENQGLIEAANQNRKWW